MINYITFKYWIEVHLHLHLAPLTQMQYDPCVCLIETQAACLLRATSPHFFTLFSLSIIAIIPESLPCTNGIKWVSEKNVITSPILGVFPVFGLPNGMQIAHALCGSAISRPLVCKPCRFGLLLRQRDLSWRVLIGLFPILLDGTRFLTKCVQLKALLAKCPICHDGFCSYTRNINLERGNFKTTHVKQPNSQVLWRLHQHWHH